MIEKINSKQNHQQTPKNIGKYFNQKTERSHPPKTFSESSFVESNPEVIKNSILSQVHYYFSIENLCRDIYLRCNMTEEGWVSVPFVCSFNRMKSFDENLVINTIQSSSDHLEINSEMNGIRIKSLDNRKLWILSEEVKNGFLIARSQSKATDGTQNQDPEGWETVISKNHNNRNNQLKFDSTTTDEKQQEMFEFSDSDSSHEEQDFFSKERRNFDYVAYSNDKDQEKIVVVQEEEEEEYYYSTDEEFNYSDEEEDDLTIDDQEDLMKKLIIVTQSPFKKNKINSRKYMSNEIASIINDGLYFYEQDLKRKKQPTTYNTLIIDEKKITTTPTTINSTILNNNNNNIKSDWNINNNNSSNHNKKPTMAQLLKEHHLGIPIESIERAPTRLYSPKPKNLQPNQRNNNNQQYLHNNGKNSIGWVVSSGSNNSSPSTTPRGTPTNSTSSMFGSSASSDNHFKVGSMEEGLPFFQHPSYELLEENGFVQHKYDKYKNKCLKDRKRLGIGKSSEMNTLFRFWSHFLRSHYIQKIYQEFISIALEDSKQGANYGMECVFRFYSYGLEKKFKPEVFNDFQTYTLADYKTGSVYALEKFWAFLKYRKDQTPLEIIPELNGVLSKFKSIHDFRKSSSQSSSSQSSSQSSSNKNNNNNNYHHKSYNSTKKPQPQQSSSSYQSNNNNSSSSMKSTKTNTLPSNSSKMMNSNKNGFM